MSEPEYTGRGSGVTFNTPDYEECCDPSARLCGELERGEIVTDAAGHCTCEACHGNGSAGYMAKLAAFSTSQEKP